MKQLKPSQIFGLLERFEVNKYMGMKTFTGSIVFNEDAVCEVEIKYSVEVEAFPNSIEFALEFFIRIDKGSFATGRLYEKDDQLKLIKKFTQIGNKEREQQPHYMEAYSLINTHID